jgi:hypothetical protein
VFAELQAQLKTLQAEADAIEAQLFAANPRYSQLVTAGAGAAELRKALRPGEVYLKILPLTGRSYGVLVTPQAVKPSAMAHLPYVARKLREGVPLHAMTRHMLGLFNARPGGRAWRRVLSERGGRAGADEQVNNAPRSEVSQAAGLAA